MHVEVDSLRIDGGRPERQSRGGSRPAIGVKAALSQRADALQAQHQAAIQRQQAVKKQRAAAAAAKKKAAADRSRRIRALGYRPGTTDPRDIARQIMASKYGWGADQFRCYDKLVVSESNWRVDALNPSSGAYGIPQSLPADKMASAGSDWRTNPATQITWALGYIKQRYGSPCEAWSFKRGHGWY